MRIRYLLICLFAIVFFNGCFKEEWKGWVYPDKKNLANYRFMGKFKSLSECRTSTINYINSNSLQFTADFECGLNCRSEYGINICEETSR